jgi:hypothetical protein
LLWISQGAGILLKECTGISEKVVRRLMKQEGLIVAKPKRRRYNSYLGEIGAALKTSSIETSMLLRPMRSGSPTLLNSRFLLARFTCRQSLIALTGWW